MKRIVPVLCLCFAASLGFIAESADASGRTFVRSYSCGSYAVRSHAAYAAPAVYHAPVYYATPVYSVGYTPDLSAIAASLEKLTQLQEGNQQILQVLTNALPQPQRQQVEHPGLKAMRQYCAVCHDSTVAKSKGGQVVLFQNGQVTKDEKLIDAMIREVDQGTMPKDGNKNWAGEPKYQFLAFWTLKPPPDAPQPVPHKLTPEQEAKVEAMSKELHQARSINAADVERMIDRRMQIILDRLPPPVPQPIPPPKKLPKEPTPKPEK